jgi:quinoprotein glucose dehydrogenase
MLLTNRLVTLSHGAALASRLSLSVCALALCASQAQPQEWRYYGGSPGNLKYSPLDQIDTSNVKNLEVAWEFDARDYSDGQTHPYRSAFEGTPLVVDGVMYLTTSFHRLLALDPETGQKIWEFDPAYDRDRRVSLYLNRGAAYWSDGEKKRLLHGTQEGLLYSIDAQTGKLDPGFAEGGVLDMRRGMTEGFEDKRYALTSPVAVCGDVFVAGARVSDSEPRGPSGDVRGFDVRSGRELWRFHTVPRPSELGHDTWEGDSWKQRGGTNAWSIMSVDPELGWVFVPLTSPSIDFYGGDRKGANLFSDSVVALDCRTGERQWHFQTIHHDLWDWDLPAHPSLVTVRHGGREVEAVAQLTKMGFTFLLDRRTGEPLFEVEERPVPQSDIPGEASWPTQPFPVKPPPVARHSMTRDEITDVTPESRAECLEMVADAVVEGPLFRPIGRELTVMFPGTNGGPNWGGGSFDPETGVLYVNSMDVGAFVRMVERPGGDPPWRNRGTKWGRFWDSNHYPCQKPPWGTLTAIDLNTGEFRWRSVLGEFDELTARGVPRTGTPNIGGSIVTKGGLVFIAATNDSRFRAFHKETGQELWVTRLPGSGHATPMSYLGKNTGKQYVAIASGGGNKYNDNYTARLVVFALPED